MSRDHYRPVESEPEYIDNWVLQYDMLCESKFKFGLLGSIYFTGALLFILPVSFLADEYGRFWFVFISNCLFCAVVFGLSII